MSAETEVPQPAPGYHWATNVEPDFLVLQLPPLPVSADGGARDAIKALFTQRGFRPISGTDDLDLRPSNGCVLTRLDPVTAELLVTISARVGASRIPLEGIDPDWLGRVVDNGHTAVLLAEAAVRDGRTTKEDLRRDVDAGGVLAALVPSTAPIG